MPQGATPQNGKQTTSPGSERAWINHRITATGF
jgi:hypothetical protein